MRNILTSTALILCAFSLLWSQASTKQVQAMRVPNETVTIDGKLSEPEWAFAQPAADFQQQQPKEGAAATEPSEVRFLYDDQNLYIGAMLYDSEPNKLVINELLRDFNARDGDLFVIVLDTFHDRSNGYTFQTNPGGAIRDSQTYEDGRTNNQNWDGVWYVKTSVTEKGWIVEESIPFKTFRFPKSEQQTWGLQLFRLIRRKNEPTMWTPVPRQYNQFKLSFAGTLEGIEGVQPGRNLRIAPFVTNNLRKLASGKNDNKTDGGVDLKLGLGTSLVFDATYRTDFSQVEADAQQVNLTRFSLFFPEKRQFFLENSSNFQMGSAANGNNDFIPFFSRTIGLTAAGEPLPLVGGLRLSGKAGHNLIGLLNVETERETTAGAELPRSNFTVARYGRELLTNSGASVFYLGKERGSLSNRLGGADIRLNIKSRLDIDGLAIGSNKTGVGNGAAYRGGFNYDWRLLKYNASYVSLGKNFRDDMGFIPREGVGIFNASFLRRLRPRATPAVREWGPQIAYTRYTREGVGVETETINPKLNLDFADASALSFNYRFNEEALSSPFRIRTGYSIPAGRYRYDDGDVNYNSNRALRFSFNGGVRFGEYWTGNRKGVSGGGRFRFNRQVAASLNYSRDNVDLPGLSFATDLASFRLDTAFSTRMFLNAFIQYNSQNHQVVSNIRFNFIHHPLSDLYVVYNETRSTASAAPTRALILKMTQSLSF